METCQGPSVEKQGLMEDEVSVPGPGSQAKQELASISPGVSYLPCLLCPIVCGQSFLGSYLPPSAQSLPVLGSA